MLRDAAIHPAYQIVKRLMDIIMSLAVVVLGLPVWIAVAIIIRLSSKGPVLYSQERVGLHSKPFTMYKFRSMVHNADEKLRQMVDFDNIEEPVFNIRKDPRVTLIGLIRLINVFASVPRVRCMVSSQYLLVPPVHAGAA